MGALGHADIARVVNERLVGIVQIEAARMVDDADEIAALDEVDVLFVGPADLSHDLRRARAGSTSRATRTRSAPSSRPASATASRPGSCLRRRRPFTAPRPWVSVHRPGLRGLVRLERAKAMLAAAGRS